MTKQVYGLTAAASTPPNEAPITVIVPHAAPLTAVAAVSSSGSTRFGNAAEDAGPENAFATAIAPIPTGPSHAVWPS